MEVVDEAADPAGVLGSRRWLALVAMLLAAAMDLIDTTIVNVAIPSIQRELGGEAAALEWMVAGYALAFGVMLITGGRLGDAFGRRRVFLLGVGAFMAASLLSGLAPTPGVLILGRVIQGLAAAVMVPQILTVIQVNFAPAERRKAYAAYSACAAIATVSGPLVGGALVQADLFGLGWRPIFLVNVILGLVALLATAAWLPESRVEHTGGFDLAGVGLLVVALLLLLYPLVQGPQLGWPVWVFGLLAVAVAMLVVFAVHQHWQQRRGRWPLVTLSLFGQRGFIGGVVTQLALYAGITGFFLVLALTLQFGFGFSALHTGLTFLPFSLGIALSSGVSGQLAPKLGRRLTVIGALVMAAGMTVLLLTVEGLGTHPGTWELVPGLVLAGLGMGLVAPTLVDVALTDVHSRYAGSASGVVTTSGQLGGAIGVALAGAIFFSALPRHQGPATSAAGSYSGAFAAALCYEIGIFLLTALLMLLLPKRLPGAGADEGEAS